MSCSINSRCGSILMEFVLVLPIYIFLFGALFLIGDIGLNAIRISTGDHDVAMDAGDREGHSFGPFMSQQMGEEKSNVTAVDSRTHRANENFRGAWSWQSAGKTYFSYRLRSWGSELVSYPFLNYNGSTSAGGILGTLVGGGAAVFHSKDYSLSSKVRLYNYYTLKRTDLARDPQAYRNWDSWDEGGNQDVSRSRLVDSSGRKQYWQSKIYNEEFADSNPDKLDAGRQGGDSLPSRPSGRKEYKRFEAFVTWSQ